MKDAPIYQEIENTWKEMHQEVGIPASDLSEFGIILSSIKSECISQTEKHLQPWLGIFEFGLQWLSNLHVAFVTDEGSLPKAPSTVPWVLIGTGCSYGMAIKTLTLEGLDTPARVLLRSFTETLLLCLATLADHELGRSFAAAQLPDEVKSFWHKTVSTKKLHQRIMAIETSFGRAHSPSTEVDETVDEMSLWRKGIHEILSQAVHPSYVAACLTCLAPTIENPNKFEPALIGKASISAKLTISYAAMTLWYFSRFGYLYIFEGKGDVPPLVDFDKLDEVHRSILIGRDVLSKLTMEHWDTWQEKE
jgi:hypothetical protein